MAATFNSLKTKIQGLIDKSNSKTGNTDSDLTTAVDNLIDGFGEGGGELYELESAEELPEDAPDGSLALVEVEGSSNTPQAYTVTSVDELPSDAVDGSTAIVPSDSIEGTWQPNDVLNITIEGEFFVANRTPNLTDTELEELGSENSLYSTFAIGLCFLEGTIMGRLVDYNSNYVDYYEEGNWYRFNKPITFLEDTDSAEFREFVKSNCNRLSGGYSLYTRENGQWVYKCEVV